MTSAYPAAERASTCPPAGPSLRLARLGNLGLACVLIALADDPTVTITVGAATLLLAAGTGLATAWRRTRASWLTTSPAMVAVWLLGLVALAVAAGGIFVAADPVAAEAWRIGGIAMFAVQVGMILALDTTLGGPWPRAGV